MKNSATRSRTVRRIAMAAIVAIARRGTEGERRRVGGPAAGASAAGVGGRRLDGDGQRAPSRRGSSRAATRPVASAQASSDEHLGRHRHRVPAAGRQLGEAAERQTGRREHGEAGQRVGQVARRDERPAEQREHERHRRRQRVGRLLGAGHPGDEAGDAGDGEGGGDDQQHDAGRIAPVGAERQRRDRPDDGQAAAAHDDHAGSLAGEDGGVAHRPGADPVEQADALLGQHVAGDRAHREEEEQQAHRRAEVGRGRHVSAGAGGVDLHGQVDGGEDGGVGQRAAGRGAGGGGQPGGVGPVGEVGGHRPGDLGRDHAVRRSEHDQVAGGGALQRVGEPGGDDDRRSHVAVVDGGPRRGRRAQDVEREAVDPGRGHPVDELPAQRRAVVVDDADGGVEVRVAEGEADDRRERDRADHRARGRTCGSAADAAGRRWRRGGRPGPGSRPAALAVGPAPRPARPVSPAGPCR